MGPNTRRARARPAPGATRPCRAARIWLARRLFHSNVKVAYGHAGSLPAELGHFDTVVMGNVLQHLQDPVGVVLQAIRHTARLIVTEAGWMPDVADDHVGLLMFMYPSPSRGTS